MASRHGLKALAILTLAATLALGACGRRGALDVPGTTSETTTGYAAEANDPAVQPVQPSDEQTVQPASDRFFLDFLI